MATNERWGAWTVFTEDDLRILGASDEEIAEGSQPISRMECAMIPLVFTLEKAKIAGRDIWFFVDNSSSLCAMVKGTSHQGIMKRLVARTWIEAHCAAIRV